MARKPKKQKCKLCGKQKSLTNGFYSTNSTFIYKYGKIDICKECIYENSRTDDQYDISKLQNILQMIDRPFIYHVWQSCIERYEDNKVLGQYFRLISSLPQYSDSRWKDSEFKDEKQIDSYINEKLYSQNKKNEVEIINNTNLKDNTQFILTDDIVEKWGYGYTPEEYKFFEKKYELLKNNYSEKTAMHSEALKTYIRYRVKEEMATAKGDVKQAKEWGQLASKAATDAKINPSQLSKADLSDGLSTFSELSQAVEEEVDIIPILPKFKYKPNDALDFNIWCYINYMRDLSGLPLCKYEDVYAFYDKRKKDYIEQYGDPYGIFINDPTEKNRENVKRFINEDGVE